MRALVRERNLPFTLLGIVLAASATALALLALAPGGNRWLLGTAATATITSDPVAVSWEYGRTDVFARASDGSLWHQWQIGNDWFGPESLGGLMPDGDAPAAASWASGRLDVFVRNSANGLSQRFYDNAPWSQWITLSAANAITSAPTAVSWGPNRVDVFARGNPDGLWHMWWDGAAWRGPENLGGQLVGRPVVTTKGHGTLYIFVRGLDNALYTKWYADAVWHDWVRIGGDMRSPAGAFTVGYGGSHMHMVLFNDATGNQTMMAASTTSGWQSQSQGSAAGMGAPSLAREREDTLARYSRGPDGQLFRSPLALAGNFQFAGWEPVKGGATYVTDIRVIAGEGNPCPTGWIKNTQDLNEGAGGDYLYLCVKRGPKDQALHWVKVLDTDDGTARTGTDPNTGQTRVFDSNCSPGSRIDPTDLNRGAGGHYIYFCFGRLSSGATAVVKDIDFNVWRSEPIMGNHPCTNSAGARWAGWVKAAMDANSQHQTEHMLTSSGDLNAGAGGRYIYACLLTERN